MAATVPPPPEGSPSPDPAEARRRLVETFRLLAASSSFVTLYAGGWAAVALGILVGPYLAALLQMLDGNLQPAPVTVRWPVVATALAAALPIPLAVRRRFTLAGFAVLPLLAVVAWQLRVMYEQAGVGAVRS